MKKTKDEYLQNTISEQIKGEMIKKGKEISLFVEDFDSESFWRNLVEFAKPELKGKTYIQCPKAHKIDGKSAMGKDHLKKFTNLVDKEIIICCDSDNDYLIDETVWYYNKPYIFHTYTHAIENHKCYPQILSDICEDRTALNFDFKPFFDWYSEEIYPILVYWLFIHNNYNYGDFAILIKWENLQNVNLTFPSIFTNEQTFKKEVKGNVKIFEEALKNIVNDAGLGNFQIEFDDFKKEFDKKSLQTETIYYLQGHSIFTLVNSILEEVINSKIEERKILLKASNYTNNELAQFENSTKQDIHTLLYNSYQKCLQNFRLCSFMEKIMEDLRKNLTYTQK